MSSRLSRTIGGLVVLASLRAITTALSTWSSKPRQFEPLTPHCPVVWASAGAGTNVSYFWRYGHGPLGNLQGRTLAWIDRLGYRVAKISILGVSSWHTPPELLAIHFGCHGNAVADLRLTVQLPDGSRKEGVGLSARDPHWTCYFDGLPKDLQGGVVQFSSVSSAKVIAVLKL